MSTTKKSKARAPRPGAGRRAEQATAAKRVLRLRIGDETRLLVDPENLPMKERLIVRKATGLPVEAFIGQIEFGLDSLQVLWWLAGRAAGDAFLTLAKVVDEWPEGLTPDDVDLVEITDDDEDIDDADPQS